MTIRPGYYDASRPRLRGVIRNDSYPWYVCTHDHANQRDAQQCARDAIAVVKEKDPQNKGLRTADLPEGWFVFDAHYHRAL
jgi:hypothetical protein